MKYQGRELPHDPSLLISALVEYTQTGTYHGPSVAGTESTLSSEETEKRIQIDSEDTDLRRALVLAWQAGIAQGKAIEKIKHEPVQLLAREVMKRRSYRAREQVRYNDSMRDLPIQSRGGEAILEWKKREAPMLAAIDDTLEKLIKLASED
jgi:hypothetical protein